MIDASGTYANANPLGAGGLPARGEAAARAAGHVVPALPDVLGADRERFAGTRTLVVGMGHSAANTLLALVELARTEPGTEVWWAIRKNSPARLYGDADGLPARGRPGTALKAAVESGQIRLVRGFVTTALTRARTGPSRWSAPHPRGSSGWWCTRWSPPPGSAPTCRSPPRSASAWIRPWSARPRWPS
nr:hypothetical protein [Carbonactinospora thermoautotrophica]